MTFETVRLGDVVLFNPRESIKKGVIAKKIDMSVLQPFTRDVPSYELIGTTLRIRFRALESALIDQPKVPKDQNDTLGDTLADKLITLINSNPQITQEELAEKTKVSVPSIKRAIKNLSDNGKIERKGGKRFGYWEVK